VHCSLEKDDPRVDGINQGEKFLFKDNETSFLLDEIIQIDKQICISLENKPRECKLMKNSAKN
jgi:hypothetical protein